MKGDPLCRGWLASGVLAYCGETHAEKLIELSSDGLRGFLMKPESRREDWVPIGWLVEALTLADRTAGNGDDALAWPIGGFLASREIGAVHALAARLLRPSVIMSLAPGLWVTHFRNAGRVVARGRGEREMVIGLVDVPKHEKVLCLGIGGWMEGFLRLGSRWDICVRHIACSCAGASSCEYTVSWMD
jgi:hypothetical protein